MPVCFIEAPPGIRNEAKKKMVAQITAAIDEAFHIGETLIFLREYSPEMLQWMAAFSRRIQKFLRR
jgi:phenylpyruvate tautomerase PptA (4-oxalocrotonate tautomerase family)